MAERIDFKALDSKGDLMWTDVSGIDWKAIPVGPDDEFRVHAHNVAHKARSFHQYWFPPQHVYAMKLERWLVDYNLAHRRPDQRGPFG